MGKKDKNYKFTGKPFINPYNFIPTDFSKGGSRPLEKPDELERTHSGVLKCELLPMTQLAIPDTEKISSSDGHKEYDFMRTSEGKLMIPGSSIRGAVRSMYEALTNSCYVTAVPEEVITYRTKIAFNPGLIKYENKEWSLYKAKRYLFSVDDLKPFSAHPIKQLSREELNNNYKHGQMIYFTAYKKGDKDEGYKKNGHTVGYNIKSIVENNNDGAKDGYLCIGESSRNKHFESVFCEDSKLELDEQQKEYLKRAVNNLKTVLNTYNDESVNINRKKKGADYYPDRNYTEIQKGTYYPVWYKIAGKNVYLSVAAIGRSVYNKSMNDMLGSHHIPCKDRNNLCPACMIFGMTGEDSSTGSRIRITDAVTKDPVPSGKHVTLKELAAPKASYTPFYLREKRKEDVSDWSYDNDALSLRGRKMYWHNINQNYSDSKKNERNVSMELCDVGENNRFLFSVYYDHLTKEELSKLIWTLTLGENNESSRHCYKIGHGKPIGLGSVKITIREKSERIFENGTYRLEKQEQKDIYVDKGIFDDLETVKAILTMTDLDFAKHAKIPVCYPSVVDSNGNIYSDASNAHAQHQWFSTNYQLGSSPEYLLPEIDRCNEQPLKFVTYVGNEDSNTREKPDTKYNSGTFKETEATIKFFKHKENYGFAESRELDKDIKLTSRVIQGYNNKQDYKNKKANIKYKEEKGKNYYIAEYCELLK